MIPGRPRCSAEARRRHEPLIATASLVTSWLLIEQPGAWGPDALLDSQLPPAVARPLLAKADGLGIRILLIRRRTAPTGRHPVAFLAQSGGGGRPPILMAGPVPHPEALLDLDLASLAQGRPQGFGQPVDEPIYLVCTHGRHDICCADHGRPLYRALSTLLPERTWETSHIGGDRFAANVVVLPRGDYFGRLEPDDAPSFMDEYEAGRLDLAHYRGRSSQPRLVQAAERFLRAADPLTGFDDLELVSARRPVPLRAEVVFQGPGPMMRRVQVAAEASTAAVYLTCRAPAMDNPVDYHLLSIETL
ncbi:MAG: sucrase ferredoxin [Actinomycetota bacterium]|nr:sucrase ferredoxin [Actinomycetota bacterium]